MHAQQPARRAAKASDFLLGFFYLAEDAAAAHVERLALGRADQPARGAIEQPHAEPCFEPGDGLRDRRRRDAERTRRGGETAALDRLHECGQLACAVLPDLCHKFTSHASDAWIVSIVDDNYIQLLRHDERAATDGERHEPQPPTQ